MILTATVDSERSGGGIELRGAVGGAWNYRGQRGGRGRSEAKKRSRQRCDQGRSRLSRSEGRSDRLRAGNFRAGYRGGELQGIRYLGAGRGTFCAGDTGAVRGTLGHAVLGRGAGNFY